MTLSCTLSYVVSPREKEKKRNINNNLAVLPSHDSKVWGARERIEILAGAYFGHWYLSFSI